MRLQPARRPDPLHRRRRHPTSLAIVRTDKCVSPAGLEFLVKSTISSIFPSTAPAYDLGGGHLPLLGHRRKRTGTATTGPWIRSSRPARRSACWLPRPCRQQHPGPQHLPMRRRPPSRNCLCPWAARGCGRGGRQRVAALELSVPASVGCHLATLGDDVEKSMDRADVAMYAEKRRRRADSEQTQHRADSPESPPTPVSIETGLDVSDVSSA